jgi:hypothetical protein
MFFEKLAHKFDLAHNQQKSMKKVGGNEVIYVEESGSVCSQGHQKNNEEEKTKNDYNLESNNIVIDNLK